VVAGAMRILAHIGANTNRHAYAVVDIMPTSCGAAEASYVPSPSTTM
jgi:hypothetical protein